MIPLPPEAGRQLGEAVYRVLDEADRLIALAERMQPSPARTSVQTAGRELFEVAKSQASNMASDVRALAPGFSRILQLSDDLLRIIASVDEPGIRSHLMDIAKRLAEASSQFAPAIKAAAEKGGLPWANRIKA
jgi:hypothetical protein